MSFSNLIGWEICGFNFFFFNTIVLCCTVVYIDDGSSNHTQSAQPGYPIDLPDPPNLMTSLDGYRI